jgi:hypothetical protein
MSSVDPDDFIKITTVLALNYLATPTRQVEMDDVLYLKHTDQNDREIYSELGTLSEVKSRTRPGTTFGPQFTNNLYLKRHRTPSLQTLSRNSLRPEHMDVLQTIDMPMPHHTRSPDTSSYNSKRRKTGNSSLRRARSRNMRVRRSRSRNYRLKRARSRKSLRK